MKQGDHPVAASCELVHVRGPGEVVRDGQSDNFERLVQGQPAEIDRRVLPLVRGSLCLGELAFETWHFPWAASATFGRVERLARTERD